MTFGAGAVEISQDQIKITNQNASVANQNL